MRSFPLTFTFSPIESLIWGSQVDLLEGLNISNQPRLIDEAKPIFELAKNDPANEQVYKNATFEGWLNYLVARGLMKIDGPNLLLTSLGHEYLVFRVDERLPRRPY